MGFETHREHFPFWSIVMEDAAERLARLEALAQALDRRAKSLAHTQQTIGEQIKLLRRETAALQGQVQALRQHVAA